MFEKLFEKLLITSCGCVDICGVMSKFYSADEGYLTRPMALYTEGRDGEYLTDPVMIADASDREENSGGGDGDRRICDGRIREERLAAYTEWRSRHGEDGEMQDYHGCEDGDISVHALQVSEAEMEVVRAEQDETNVHTLDLGCCGWQHCCHRLGKKGGEGWLMVCYAAMDGAPGKVIGTYLYVREEHKFCRDGAINVGRKDNKELWTVQAFIEWCRLCSGTYLYLLDR